MSGKAINPIDQDEAPVLPSAPGYMAVTPAMARYWLKNKAINREISRSVVANYVRDMKAGRWAQTDQGIGFNEDGRLVNGQHRLTALCQLGIVLRVLVVPGLSREAILAMDRGFQRNAAANIRIAGGDATRDQCSVALAMYGRATGGKSSLSVGALEEFVNLHRAAIDFGVPVRTSGPRGVGQAHIAAAVSMAWYWEDRARLKAFRHVLVNGMPGDPPDEDAAAVLLRNFLIAGRLPGNASAGGVRRETYLRTQRAAQLFCARKSIKKLYAPSADIYLLPEDAEAAGILDPSIPKVAL